MSDGQKYPYRRDWLAYKAKYWREATMDYDMFCRIVRSEEQAAFFRDAGRQAGELYRRNNQWRPDPLVGAT